MYAKIRNVPAFMIEGPIARPSRPSVEVDRVRGPDDDEGANVTYIHAGSSMPCS